MDVSANKEGAPDISYLVILRMTAVCVLLFRLALFIVGYLVLDRVYPRFGFLPEPVVSLLYVLSIAATVPSIIWPAQLYFYAVTQWIWGILSIVSGGGIGSMLLYLLGCGCAYKMGFFRTWKRAKISLLTALPALAVLSQFRLGSRQIITTLSEFVILVYVLTLSAVFFRKDLRLVSRANREEKALPDLSKIMLSPQQAAMLAAVMSDKKYSQIAVEHDMAVSTFKKRIKELFTTLGVEDKAEFVDRYADVDFATFASVEEEAKEE